MNLHLPRRFASPTSPPRRGSWGRTAYALVLLASLASASISAMAQSFVDTDPELYRCAVLGDTRACRQPAARPEVRYEEWIQLGDHAKYLRYLGAEQDEAIAKARRLGEEPMRHVVQVSRIPLTPEQAYARAMSQRLVPDEATRTLSVTPVHEERPLLHNDWSASFLSLPSKCPPGTRPEAQDADAHPARCRDVASRAK